VTDQPTLVAADLIRAAVADAVTICNGPLIDHAASGVLYALGMLDTPPVDGAPGPIPPGGNAEDCPRCNDPLLPYPWVCPGHGARTAPDNPAASNDDELTADEARAEVDRLARELYLAQDALDYVAEWCDLTDRKQLPITTADVRTWLKGARCGRQLAADRAAVERASEPTEPGTTASDDGLREQYAAAIWERQNPGRQWADCEYRWRADAEADADAVMAVRDRRLEQLTRARDLAIAHDRQPYPTAWAYEQACKALETHRKRADDAEATLAAIQRLADRYPVDIDTAHLEAALDGQDPAEDPAEDIDDWCDQPPDETPGCTATLRMFETVIHCTDHRPGIHRGPLPNSASTHAWGDYAAGATPHNPDDTKEAGQ
jgi:hypothetical protein